MIKVRQKISGSFRTLRGDGDLLSHPQLPEHLVASKATTFGRRSESAVGGAPFIPSAPNAGP